MNRIDGQAMDIYHNGTINASLVHDGAGRKHE